MLVRVWIKGSPLYIVGKNVNWCNHYGKYYGGSSKKQNIEQPYDSAISFMGIYLEKIKTTVWKSKYIEALGYNSKAVENTWGFINRWMDKDVVDIPWNIMQPWKQ